MKNNKIRDIVFMAMYVALFAVLDFIGNMVPLLQMPNGGSVSISIIALLIASYHLGVKKGLIVSICTVFVMFITGPMYTKDLLGFVLDYLLAFGVYGLASLFPTIGYFYLGAFITGFIRFSIHTISGMVIWDVPFVGSVVYNFPYMAATTVLSLILLPLLIKLLQPVIRK